MDPRAERPPRLVRGVRPVHAALDGAPCAQEHLLLHVGAVPRRDAAGDEHREDERPLGQDRLDARVGCGMGLRELLEPLLLSRRAAVAPGSGPPCSAGKEAIGVRGWAVDGRINAQAFFGPRT